MSSNRGRKGVDVKSSRRSRLILCIGALLATSSVLAACGSSTPASSSGTSSSGAALNASAPGITPTTITIGFEADLTGLAASDFADGWPAAEARVDMQNAEGGVDGRKLKLVKADDQTSPTEALTAAQFLVESDNVFGIITDSAVTFGAATYLTHADIPVTGDGIDGPEWGTAANMFDIEEPSNTTYPNGDSYTYLNLSNLLKSIGATSVATLGYSISPSSVLTTKQTVAADSADGLKNCYENTSVPFGGVNFTAIALQIKQAGCDAVVASFVSTSNVALAQALDQAGLNLKQFYYTSYGQDTIDSPSAAAALNGTYTEGTASSGTSAVVQANLKWYKELKQYDPSYSGGIPDSGQEIGWDATDTMIEGLEVAGRNPTRASFISNLRKVNNYTIGGLFSSPLSFNYLTGNFPSNQCDNFVELEGKQFVPVPANGSAVCGNLFTYKGGS
jgi:ABC-type branched-subunit amino acid transport system substrate-binding protein